MEAGWGWIGNCWKVKKIKDFLWIYIESDYYFNRGDFMMDLIDI
jgi:hypothetical protein